MNKQQLAQKIWASANQMRSKIEASEYKDFILGFIFYKYLSDKEIEFLKANDYDDELLTTVSEDDEETVKWVQQNIGYFIAYSDLFTTWLGMGKDFDVSNVRDALSAFNRLISPTHKRVFEKIFNTLETGLSKLGDSSGTQTKAISGLLNLIKDIPMDGRQGYDVLKETSDISGIPVMHTTGRKCFLDEFLADGRDARYIGEPIPLETYMHRSWEAFTTLGL